MSIFSFFHFFAFMNFWLQLGCKYAQLAFLLYLWLYLTKREHKQPYIRVPHQLYLVGEVFRVRIKIVSYVLWVEALLIEPSFRLFQMAFVSKQELILSSIVMVTLKEWLVLWKKLNFIHSNVGVKVQPYYPSVLIVYPTQMLKYLRFNYDCGVCGKDMESTS